mgnify:CR=1 FL=1
MLCIAGCKPQNEAEKRVKYVNPFTGNSHDENWCMECIEYITSSGIYGSLQVKKMLERDISLNITDFD